MYLQAYNGNFYLHVLQELEQGLRLIEQHIAEALAFKEFLALERLKDVYEGVFSSELCGTHLAFSITRTLKVLPFRETAFDRSNSYYHLKLLIKSPELVWLDELYGGSLSKVLKYYKALFSKIDNTFANNNERQKEAAAKFVEGARKEIERLFGISDEKMEINSERRRLQSQHLQKLPFQGLFHMTHIANLSGILRHGIYSHTIARTKNLMQRDISNPEINAKRQRAENVYYYKIHDYAPLYINPKNPMLKARCEKGMREELVLVKVSPNILVNQNVLFTDGNAAEESSLFYNDLENFNKLNWGYIHDEYYFGHADGRRVRCSEVLVHEQIRLPYIDELILFNEKPLEQLYHLFPNHAGINLKVDKEMFY